MISPAPHQQTPRATAAHALRSFSRGAAFHRPVLLIIVVLLALLVGRAQAQYTIIDSGSNQTFIASATNAAAYSWTLDGSSVGTSSATFTYSPDLTAVGTHDLIVYQTLATGGTTTAEWGLRVRIPISTSSKQYYVATTGSDSNNGSIGAPFRSLEAAQTIIRGLARPLPPGGVTVFLRSGTYWRTSTFMLTGSDSGTPSAPVIYTAYPGETVVLSTGTALPSRVWAQLALSETNRVTTGVDVTRIWETDASLFTNKGPYPVKYGTWPVRNAQATTTSVPDLFYNDSRAWLSRYPNHNPADDYLTPNLKMDGIAADLTGTAYLNTSGTYLNSSGTAVAVGGAFHYYSADADHVTRWKTALSHGGLWLQGFWRVTWQSDVAQVLDIDTVNQVVEFAPNAAPNGGFGNKYTRPVGSLKEPYWAINLLEEMDQPGEWAVDFSRKKLYFLMDQDGAPPDGSVVVADYTGPVVQISGSNIILQSLAFDESLGVGVLLSNTASRNLVIGCSFRNMTNMAVSIQSGSLNGVVSCNMNEMGSMVSQITSSGTAGSASPNQGNFVVNNKMTGVGRYAQVYQPGLNMVYPSAGNRVAHNYIYDIPQMGVQFAGYRNLYEYNNISKYGTLVDDNGAFYSYEDFYGNDTFRYNYEHDTPLASAITYDGGSRTVSGHYYGNISQQNSACEGQSLGIGLCSQIDCINNMSIGGGRYGSFDFTSATQSNINNNVAIGGYYPPDFRWSQVTVVNGSNVYTTASGDVLGNGPNLSYASDPGFIDMAGEDLRLRPDSQLLNDLPNFKPIPFEMNGLYNDEYRTDAKTNSPFIVTRPLAASGTSVTMSGTLVYPRFDGNTAVSVYWGTVDGGADSASWQHVISLGVQPAIVVSTTIGGLDPAIPYYYRYFASNPYGTAWAPTSGSSGAAPAAPPGGITVTGSNGQLILAWSAADWAQTYIIQRASSPGGTYVTVGTVSGTSFTDTALTTGQTYYYTVTASNTLGSSPASSTVQGTVPPGARRKANNATTLDLAGSWTAGVVPNSLDTAFWSGTYDAVNQPVSVGSGLTVESIMVGTLVRSATITAGVGSINLVAAGGIGLDLSVATQDVAIGASVTLGSPQSWNIASGRTLSVAGSIGDAGQGCSLTLTGSGTLVLTGSNTFSGGLTITPPAGGLPVYKYGGNNPAPDVKVSSGAIGPIVANGRLDILNAATIGTILGTGSTGFIANSSTARNILTFQAGSSFSMFNFGADYSQATLRSTGTSAVTFLFYGYNVSSPNASYTIDGGSWVLNQIGQNNTGAQTSGATTVTGAAFVKVATQTGYSHGTWNVTSGTLQFAGGVSENNGNATATNTSLVFNVNNSGGGPGSLIISGGLTLSDGGGAAEGNSATVGAGGQIYLQSGGLTLGSATAHPSETDTFNLQPGGRLIVYGAISAGSGTTGQTHTFNWTGGQLTAATVTTGSGFAAPAAGGISATDLYQSSGTLAPGDTGVAGKTAINGNYYLDTSGTLAIDIGGTTRASGFQTGQYDYLTVSGSTTLHGNLAVSLINGFVPISSQTFTVLTSSGTITGGFANAAFGGWIPTTDGKAALLISSTNGNVNLSNYTTINPPTISVQPASATVAAGTAVTLSVSASASIATPNSYQWYLGTGAIPGATGPAYTIASANLIDTGDYSVMVANTAGSVKSGTATLTVYTPLQFWRLTSFGTINNIGNAADLADPDGDGVPNLMEYALSTNPASASSVSRPVTAVSGGYLTLRFARSSADVTYLVEGSFDLDHWTTIATNPGTVGSQPVVSDTAPISGSSRRFMRLKVTNP